MIINRIAIALIIAITAILVSAVTVEAQTQNGTITGIVLDRMGNNIPNATVTLLQDGQLVDTFQNPQVSNKDIDPYATIGRYQFSRLPYGRYTVVAEKRDAAGLAHTSVLTVDLDASTTTADIVIQDLVVVALGTPSPSPTLTASPGSAHTPLCTIGLILPLLGICVLFVNKKR